MNFGLLLVDPGLWTIHMNYGDLVLSGVIICSSHNLDILGMKFTFEANVRRPYAWYCLSCLSKNWYFEVGEECLCAHLCVTLLLLCICSPNPRVLFSGVGVCSWMSSSASRAPGVFGGQALPWSELFVVASSMSYCALCMFYKVNSNSNHCLLSKLPSASLGVWRTRVVAAALPSECEVSRCRTSLCARCFLPAQIRV